MFVGSHGMPNRCHATFVALVAVLFSLGVASSSYNDVSGSRTLILTPDGDAERGEAWNDPRQIASNVEGQRTAQTAIDANGGLKAPDETEGGTASASFTNLQQRVTGSTPSGTIQIGTPPTNMTVIFDTGSDKFVAKTWATVMSELRKVDASIGQAVAPTGELYNHNRSSTYEAVYSDLRGKKVQQRHFIRYGSGDVITEEGKDTLEVAGQRLTGFQVSEIAADSLRILHSSLGISGVLGLQHMRNQSLGESVFSRCRQEGSMYSFGYCRDIGKNSGTMLWGDQSSDGAQIQVIGQMHWAVALSSVRASGGNPLWRESSEDAAAGVTSGEPAPVNPSSRPPAKGDDGRDRPQTLSASMTDMLRHVLDYEMGPQRGDLFLNRKTVGAGSSDFDASGPSPYKAVDTEFRKCLNKECPVMQELALAKGCVDICFRKWNDDVEEIAARMHKNVIREKLFQEAEPSVAKVPEVAQFDEGDLGVEEVPKPIGSLFSDKAWRELANALTKKPDVTAEDISKQLKVNREQLKNDAIACLVSAHKQHTHECDGKCVRAIRQCNTLCFLKWKIKARELRSKRRNLWKKEKSLLELGADVSMEGGTSMLEWKAERAAAGQEAILFVLEALDAAGESDLRPQGVQSLPEGLFEIRRAQLLAHATGEALAERVGRAIPSAAGEDSIQMTNRDQESRDDGRLVAIAWPVQRVAAAAALARLFGAAAAKFQEDGPAGTDANLRRQRLAGTLAGALRALAAAHGPMGDAGGQVEGDGRDDEGGSSDDQAANEWGAAMSKRLAQAMGKIIQRIDAKRRTLKGPPSGLEASAPQGGAMSFCEDGAKCAAIIDTGSNIIAGPLVHIRALARKMNVHRNCSNIHDLPNLELSLGGHSISLPASSYVMRLQLPKWAMGASDAEHDALSEESSLSEGASRRPWAIVAEHYRKNFGVDILAATELDLELEAAFRGHATEHELCMPAFVALDKKTKTVLGDDEYDLWVVGTPLFDSYYTRFSWHEDETAPSVFVRDLRKAPACTAASSSTLLSDGKPTTGLMRSEARSAANAHGDTGAGGARGAVSSRIDSVLGGPPVREVDEIRYPHWAFKLDAL